MRKPSAFLYLLCLVVFVAACGGFAFAVKRERARTAAAIEGFQRFIAPGFGLFEEDKPGAPNHGATVLEVKEAGPYTVFYESHGVYREFPGDQGQAFDTPTDQLWPVRARMAMTLEVARNDGADTGEKVVVRAAGIEADAVEQKRLDANPRMAMPKNRGLVVYRRAQCGRDGHGLWLVDIPTPGFYKFETRYVEGIHKDPASIAVPPEPTREQIRSMRAYELEAYDKARRTAQEDQALAKVEPSPVLLAFGRDPVGQRLFDPTGFYGIAALCAFGLTLSMAGAILVWMMRGKRE